VIFVDTGAWFASFVSSDADHAAALDWLQGNTTPLITSDYIIDELLSLLRYRGEFATDGLPWACS
jgi:predicted nucleic acid-binding protein